MNNSRLPQTDSIQELAEFWDNHDLADFEEQLEEVKEPIFQQDGWVQIRLPLEEIKIVKQLAKSKGMDSSDLIREWILEKVRIV